MVACTLMMLTPSPGDASGGELAVYLTSQGGPARLKDMPVWAVDSDGKLWQSRTDSYGRAFLHNLPPGEYWVDLGAGFPRKQIKLERGRVDLKFEVPNLKSRSLRL